MRTNRVKRRSAIVSVLGAAAMLAVSAAPASGAPMYEQSVEVNGVVKAHSVYFSAGNTYCANLLNAQNHPLVYAQTILQLTAIRSAPSRTRRTTGRASAGVSARPSTGRCWR